MQIARDSLLCLIMAESKQREMHCLVHLRDEGVAVQNGSDTSLVQQRVKVLDGTNLEAFDTQM